MEEFENSASFLNDAAVNFSITNNENLFLMAKKEVDSWFMMKSPWPVFSIITLYLIFITKLGPYFMKNRKPLNIKSIMLIYNLYQTISNAYIFSTVFTTGGIHYLVKHACYPLDPAKNPFWFPGFQTAWLYLFSKTVDLLDTVFFVLRKKQSHVTFLHVYHHTNMVLSSWFSLKYIPGEQLVIIGITNSFVHVIMYAYYFLSATGVHTQKYLWWKIYITRLQMLQFVIYIVYMATLIAAKCKLSQALSFYVIVQGIIFFMLFLNFYIKTYKNSKSKLNHSEQNGISLEIKKST